MFLIFCQNFFQGCSTDLTFRLENTGNMHNTSEKGQVWKPIIPFMSNWNAKSPITSY